MWVNGSTQSGKMSIYWAMVYLGNADFTVGQTLKINLVRI